MEDKILDKAEEIQKKMHEVIDALIEKKPAASYEDMYRTVLTLRLAAIELRLEELEKTVKKHIVV